MFLKAEIELGAGRAHLSRIVPAVRIALEAKIEPLAQKFVSAAAAEAPHKSYTLADDIREKVTSTARGVIAKVDIAPGKARKYASAQEQGAKIRAHEILATKARAMAFLAGGQIHFAGKVQHPGAIIPRHPFMRPTLTSMTPEIRTELTEAARDAAANA
jgi:hypothetical protein